MKTKFYRILAILVLFGLFVPATPAFAQNEVPPPHPAQKIKFISAAPDSIQTQNLTAKLVTLTLVSPEKVKVGDEVNIQTWFTWPQAWQYARTDFFYYVPAGVTTGGINNPSCQLGYGCSYAGFAMGVAGTSGSWTDKFNAVKCGTYNVTLRWISYDYWNNLVDSGTATVRFTAACNIYLPLVNR